MSLDGHENAARKTFTGRVASGAGYGAKATALPWFAAFVEVHYGFRPFPGTLNLEGADAAGLGQELLARGTVLVPPSGGHCCALMLPVDLEGPGGRIVEAVLVRPLVAGYDPERAELVADRSLREAWGLADGQELGFRVAAERARGGWAQAG